MDSVALDFGILSTAPQFVPIAVALLGLCVGSFLNVVIHRLPIMLEREWRRDCRSFLGLPDEADDSTGSFNLAWPGSHCPHCNHALTISENIPLLSYAWQRGRCRHCGQGISGRYPVIELLTAIVSVVTVSALDTPAQAICGVFFSWVLIALSAIDIDRKLLPDTITLPLLWVGLLINSFGVYVDLSTSLYGAVVGYLSLWSVFHLFRLITGKIGMGYGDFKLLAVFGAWLGWTKLLPIILLASLSGAVIGSVMLALNRQEQSTPIPFGPYLAVAAWICLLWGDALVGLYWQFAGV